MHVVGSNEVRVNTIIRLCAKRENSKIVRILVKHGNTNLRLQAALYCTNLPNIFTRISNLPLEIN